MKFGFKLVKSYESATLNLALGVVGLTIVWFASHNGWAMLGAIIAALHIRVSTE